MTGSLQNISLALNDVQNLQGALPQLLASTSSLEEIFDDDTIERISRGETSALFEDNPDLFCGSAGTSKKRRRRQAPSGSSSDSSGEYSGRGVVKERNEFNKLNPRCSLPHGLNYISSRGRTSRSICFSNEKCLIDRWV